ncbi:MAG TPA: DUF192 domain-containing protein [Acidimicrobiales bacterium]|nr:DUF192 domain-containing protein [Acidimicrobiales bacterium]
MWLLRDGEVLAAAEMAGSFVARNKGLIGRPEYEGAFLIPRTSGALHSFGMRFALDVAFLDRDLAVVDTVVLTPWHMTRPRRHCRTVLEAQSGAFERWRLRPGDRLELHDAR